MVDLWPQQSCLAPSVGLEEFMITADVTGCKTNISPNSGWTIPLFLNLNTSSNTVALESQTAAREPPPQWILFRAKPKAAPQLCPRASSSVSCGSTICLEAVAERPGTADWQTKTERSIRPAELVPTASEVPASSPAHVLPSLLCASQHSSLPGC